MRRGPHVWTPEEDETLRRCAEHGRTLHYAAGAVHAREDATARRASLLGVSFATDGRGGGPLDPWQRRKVAEVAWRSWRHGERDPGAIVAACARAAVADKGRVAREMPGILRDWRSGALARKAG